MNDLEMRNAYADWLMWKTAYNAAENELPGPMTDATVALRKEMMARRLEAWTVFLRELEKSIVRKHEARDQDAYDHFSR